MTQEQREDIEDALAGLKAWSDKYCMLGLGERNIKALIRFARQQLNLRVDGEKLMTALYAGRINGSKLMYLFEKDCWGIEEVEALEALVMECLTTEEKE
jgi:hypothetical protein